MAFVDILDDAMYSRIKLIVETKDRGVFTGIPHSVDDFETDDERLGYFIEVGDHLLSSVYLDEIVEIKDSETEAVLSKAV